MAFEAPVAIPNFGQAVPPPVDTSWLAQLPQTYRQGALQQRQLDIANAGQDATPPGASAPDMTALTNRLMQLGAYDQAGSLMQLGFRQKLLGSPSSLNDPLGQFGPQASAAPASNIPASTQGANPQVVAYVQQAAQQRHMNPNVALAVSGAEGLKGFDPNGSANPGDGNSSFGPFQLHYGNVAGSGSGNQVAGLGDDFTAATGLDARDPSTWKAQVDFALDHAAKYGWSAFHGARALGIGNFAGIGGQPSTVAAYAPQPSAAPAQAAIGAATGQPYRVASLDPVAAPAGNAPAPAAPQPQQPYGAVNGAPTANTATSQMVSPTQWAAKFNPNDPALAGKIADAIGIDPNEQIDVQDRNIRAAVLPVLQASRQAMAASPSQQPGIPTTSTAEQPGNRHPFGPGATNPESGNTVAPLHAPPPGPGSISPTSASGDDTSNGVAPAPVSSPRFAPSTPSPASASGPDAPGLPVGYQDPGGGQRYVNDILNMASRFEDAGLTGRAKVYMARAQQVQSQLEAAQKSQLDLQAHNAELSPDMKAYQQAQQQGFNGTFMDYQGALEQQKATANASGRNLVLTPGEKEYNQAAAGGFQGTQADYEAAKGAQIEEAKGQAAYLGGMPKQLATAADAARQTSGSIDQMLTAAQGFRMGAGAQMDQTTRKIMQGAFTRLGVDDPALNDSTASYEDFGKLAGVLNRQAAQQVGGRTGVQEMQLIGSTLPSPEMTYDGFRGVASSLKGSADYTIARQQASQDWLSDPSHNNSLRGFDAAFNRNVSPSAFWLARLQTDQPDLFSQTVQKLGQSAQGRSLLTKAKAGMTWANSNGLLDQ